MQELQILQTNVEVELMRSKLNVDRLKLRQQAGFCAVSPVGFNVLGTEYERVLPASSVANLFPFNYSGKTDRKGFYIGKDKYILGLRTGSVLLPVGVMAGAAALCAGLSVHFFRWE